MSDPDDDFEEAYAALCAEYAAGLPDTVAALAALVEEAATSPAAVSRARAIAHRLRGTAGSYGLPEVGEAAGEVEDALEKAPATLAERMRALSALVRGG